MNIDAPQTCKRHVHALGALLPPVEHESQVDREVRQRQQVFRLEGRRQLPRHGRRVQGSHPERDEGAGVPEDRISHLGLKLGQVLVCRDEIQALEALSL